MTNAEAAYILENMAWLGTRDEQDKIEAAIRIAVEELRSAQERKKGKWIPCDERLPEDLEEVNVTWVNHTPEQYYDFLKDKPFTGSAVYYKGEWFWYSSTCVDILAEYGTNGMDKVDDGVEVIAWMPLPEPYKGEER